MAGKGTERAGPADRRRGEPAASARTGRQAEARPARCWSAAAPGSPATRARIEALFAAAAPEPVEEVPGQEPASAAQPALATQPAPPELPAQPALRAQLSPAAPGGVTPQEAGDRPGAGTRSPDGGGAWATRSRIARRALSEPAGAPVEPEVQQAGDPDLGRELLGAMPATGPAATRRRAGLRPRVARGAGKRRDGPVSPSVRRRPAPATGQRDGTPIPQQRTAPFRHVEAYARGPPSPDAPRPTTSTAAAAPVRDRCDLDAPAPASFDIDAPAPADFDIDAPALADFDMRAHAGARARVPVLQAKLAVSTSGDRFEREADAVAERVVRGATPYAPVAGVIAGRLQRVPPHARGPPQSELPASVTAALQHGGGRPLDPALRSRIEPHVGLDLGHVRVRCEPAAARDLGARAFTSGATIFLAAGSSPADAALIAHEAAHVAQQAASPVARATLQRLAISDLIPGWILDGVRNAVRALPGYSILTTIVGEDLLTGRPAATSREELVETLLTYGPFGAAVGPLLSTIDVLGDVFAVVSEGLRANDLTLARIGRDIETAWEQFSLTNGIAGNLAIVRRLVEALLRDVARFVASIVDRVIELVRAVVAEVAEPLLETPEIKPIWDLTKKVLRYDPLRGEEVQAESVDIIADFLRLIGEEERLAQMQERGTLAQTADWLDTQLATFRGLIGELGTLFSDAWAAIQPANLPNLLTNLESLAQRAFGLVQRVAEFGATLILKVLELVKDALLGWLSEHARAVPGFELLTVILEQDPFTGERVERTARNLIRGFITLLPGGAATFDQLAESGVIDQAAERIESEMSRLGISVELVTGIFLGIWDTLTLDDLLDPIGAFERVLALFGEPLARLVEFVSVVLEVVVTLVLALMNFPSELLGRVIANATQAIDDIAADPVAFLLNMIEAIKLGFASFFDHILGHLMQGLVSWLFRGLGQLGIELPTDFSLGSILNLVFQVLGLTIEYLWEKLGQHVGPERVAMIRGALDTLGGAWAFIVDVQREGLPAIWRFISDQLGNLWSTLLQMAQEWIMTRVVSAVTTRLLSLLDPTGIMAVVNSAIALFNAIRSAIDYFRDMLEIVAGYVETLAAVAAGNIAPGAQMLEQGLANAIPIAIGFLAAQVGLGNIPEKIVEIIGRLRELVDRALDWLIEQALRLGRAALDALGLGPREPAPTAGEPAPSDEALHEPFDLIGEDHAIYADPSGRLIVASNGAQPVSNLPPLIALHDQYTALPSTATIEQRRAIIRSMIALIRQDPSLLAQLADDGLGDPPNLGGVAPHRSQTQRFQPRSGSPSYAPLWELESEHVIPRSYANALFAAFSLGGTTSSEYRAMHTILIYKGAADLKTEGPGGDNTVYQTLQQTASEVMTVALASSQPARHFGAAMGTVRGLFEGYAANAVDRTTEAIAGEHAQTYGQSTKGAIRKRPVAPPEARVEEAFTLQAADVSGMLSARLT